MGVYPWLDRVVTDATAALATVDGAEAYLTRRGVPRELWTEHRIGALPASYRLEAGTPTFVYWQRWYLRNRLIFPLTSVLGDVIGLQTRALAEKAYQTYYAGSRQVYTPVFGLAQAADVVYETEQIVLVEGVFDYFAVRRAGLRNVVAILTSRPSAAVIRFLDRYCCRVCAMLDMDEAGRQAIDRLAGLPRSWDLVAPTYPAHDPASWVDQAGTEPLRRLLTPFGSPYGALVGWRRGCGD